jgi:hypothetical protein
MSDDTKSEIEANESVAPEQGVPGIVPPVDGAEAYRAHALRLCNESYAADMERRRQFEATVSILDIPGPAPAVIEKSGHYLLGGNTPSLMPVCADKWGRLWKEDRDALTLVYDPAWHARLW